MKAIMVMFDSLNRRMLPNYGADWTYAPNFERLAQKTVTFDNCYGGSMPCMPARRELHTGRYNFMHRGWGPLEPFDDSMPEMLKNNGVYTHLVTDHQHYWEDGGATFHNRYNSYEFFRGQEGDAWKGQVADPEVPDSLVGLKALKPKLWRQDWINREYLKDEADHPQSLTFDAGLEFLQTNKDDDNWFIQIETFDPHEPFFSYADHKKHYADDYEGPHFDWPDYTRVTETPETVEHARNEYAALLTMCDASLGRILDHMDEHDMWGDTMLIVCTDHGFMLGEKGWWGKNIQPWYDETIHNPLFIWDPRAGVAGERRDSLVQTIDFAPTLLDFFGVDATADMQGTALGPVVAAEQRIRDAGMFGIFGGHACVTDGRWVYMRASTDPSNQPLFEHTLMPTQMNGFVPLPALQAAELVEGFDFTKGLKVLRTPSGGFVSPWLYGSLLFDLETDPEQANPLDDAEAELRLATLLRDLMVATDAPASQYARLGLPQEGPLDASHLLVAEQWPQLERALAPAPRADEFGGNLGLPIAEIMADERKREALAQAAPMIANSPILRFAPRLSLLQIATMMVGVLPDALLHHLDAQFVAIDAAEGAEPLVETTS